MQTLSYELDFTPNSIWNYVSANTAAKENFAYIQEAGYFFAGKKYFTIRQGLDSFLIQLTVSGGGILEYAGNREYVGHGSFYWIDCQNWQKYYTDPEIGHWNVIWVHFNGRVARAYYDVFCKLLGKGTAVATLSKDSAMLSLLENLLNRTNMFEHTFSVEQNLFEFVNNSGILTQLFIECISCAGNSGKVQQIPPTVRDISSYIAAHYNEKITLDILAARFNLDSCYLQKLFKRHSGQSPMEYIIHLRMTHAKNLIRSTTMSISEIAFTVGIDNISHFTRQFKKQVGITPGQYRKAWPNTP